MSLVGVWQLVEYLVELEDGRTIKPWGDDFLGYTVVSEEGFVSSSMIKTNVEDNVAKDSFFSYLGSFELFGDMVRISVAICSEPGLVGSVQERRIVFIGDTFTANTPDMDWDGTKGINKLTWKRVYR